MKDKKDIKIDLLLDKEEEGGIQDQDQMDEDDINK